MSRYFANIDTIEDAERATKIGMGGALVFAATIVLGLIFLFSTGNIPGSGSSPPADFLFQVAGVVIELVIVLAAAWRFYQAKGLIIGSIVLLVFLGETVVKIVNGSGAAWLIFYFAIAAAMFNGLRGAWIYRDLCREEQRVADWEARQAQGG